MRVFNRISGLIVLSTLILGLSCQSKQEQSEKTVYVPRAHAHNDYNHGRPFFDAMDHNFSSVEADIHLVDGELLVAHDLEDVKSGMTLQYMYLDPIKELVNQKEGRFTKDFPLLLLIDIKSDSFQTYQVLKSILFDYKEMLTSYENSKINKGKVCVILSGNRPALEMLAQENPRYVTYDGRISDLDSEYPASLMSMISNKWEDVFTWQGSGAMPQEEKIKLHRIVKTAHAKGQWVRFWATDFDPILDQRNLWNEMIIAQVDLINTDKLDLLEHYRVNRRKVQYEKQ